VQIRRDLMASARLPSLLLPSEATSQSAELRAEERADRCKLNTGEATSIGLIDGSMEDSASCQASQLRLRV